MSYCLPLGMLIETEKFLSEEVNDIFGKNALRYCILSGPSFAEQMLEKHPTLVVIASKDQEVYINILEIQLDIHNRLLNLPSISYHTATLESILKTM